MKMIKVLVDLNTVMKPFKPKADATLNNMKKSELIQYVRTLEYNYDVAVSFNIQQAKNIELIKQEAVEDHVNMIIESLEEEMEDGKNSLAYMSGLKVAIESLRKGV